MDIDSLIREMSIEEKAGQMSQIDLGVIAKGEICQLQQPQQLDMAKLQEAINRYHIGSVLNVGCGSGTISLENWHTILQTIHDQNKKHSRLNIPIIYGIDAIHGANYTMGATLFPQQIAQAATWNPNLVKKGYEITAYETRATGIPWNFSPVLDLGRQSLWSRFFETFGEDVYLAKKMTTAAIDGLQGEDVSSPYHLAACMKHFLGYSMPLSGKDRTPAWISDRELREYFLPTFRTAIQQGAKTVMINSGEINGTPVHANKDILTTLLRDELGFTGVAVTDWEDVYKLVNVHRVAKDKKEAVKMAVMSGIDMSMTPNDFEFTRLLIELVKEGSIPESRLDVSVKRILQLKKELGLFEEQTYPLKMYPLFGSERFANESYQVASECMTLLKNESDILPLRENEKILVCGPAANSMNLLNGAWTHTWQGIDTTYNTPGKKTILQALQHLSSNVTYVNTGSVDSSMHLDACMAKAMEADKIVIALGETPATEIPGNIDDLTITKAQIQLVEQLSQTGKPLILICNFNRPRIIERIDPLASAILYTYLSGDEGGRAIANTLYGIENPSGKLPFTYPRHVNTFVHYDHKASEDQHIDFSTNAYQPQYDFGFGLSYTQFQYEEMTISKAELNAEDSIVVQIAVKNTGKQAGKEVVQLYYNDLVASITPAVKKLVRFEKVSLKPNEKTILRFSLTKNDFNFVNKALQEITEAGDIELMISNQKKLIHVQ